MWLLSSGRLLTNLVGTGKRCSRISFFDAPSPCIAKQLASSDPPSTWVSLHIAPCSTYCKHDVRASIRRFSGAKSHCGRSLLRKESTSSTSPPGRKPRNSRFCTRREINVKLVANPTHFFSRPAMSLPGWWCYCCCGA